MPGQAVRFDGLRSLAAASISASYTAIGTAINHAGRLVKIVNNTNGDLTISFDGSTDNDYVPANSFSLYDFTTNKSLPDTWFVVSNGTTIYAKGSPSSGSVYVVVVYGSGD